MSEGRLGAVSSPSSCAAVNLIYMTDSSMDAMQEMMANFYGVQGGDNDQDATDVDASGFDAAMMVKVGA